MTATAAAAVVSCRRGAAGRQPPPESYPCHRGLLTWMTPAEARRHVLRAAARNQSGADPVFMTVPPPLRHAAQLARRPSCHRLAGSVPSGPHHVPASPRIAIDEDLRETCGLALRRCWQIYLHEFGGIRRLPRARARCRVRGQRLDMRHAERATVTIHVDGVVIVA